MLRTPKFKNSKTTKYEVFYSSHFLHAAFQFALKRVKLTKCNHVALKIDIADHVPRPTEVGRHFGC